LSFLLWIAFVLLLPENTSLQSVFSGEHILQSAFSGEHSNRERWRSIILGLEMWLASPIFGLGLGSYYHFSEEWMGRKDVIHSTPVWVLAEFGLIGATILLTISFMLFKSVFQIGMFNRRAQATLMLLFVFLLFGIFHEIFYQRIFWLALGLTLALSPSGKFNPKDEKLDA